MNILLLLISIVLLVMYMLFLARKKDFDLLKSPPKTNALPRSKYELALRELNDFKKLPRPKSKKALVEHNSEQFYLERRLYQIQQETEAEQKSYYLACKEKEISWLDYRDYFNSLTLIEKFVAPGKINELITLRNLYLDTEKRVEIEISKFNARARVRRREEQVKRQRETEIKENTLKRKEGTESDISESTQNLSVVRESIGKQPSSTELAFTQKQEDTIPAVNGDQENTISATDRKTIQPLNDTHFGQDDFKDKYPRYNGLTFIDEQLSIEQSGQAVIVDANFEKTYFVSVTFKNRHQYKNCNFQDTDFSYSKWEKPELPHRVLSCDFTGAKFNFSQLYYIAFYNCTFEFTDFQNAQLDLVKFVNCQFNDCNITNVDFSKTVMSADMLESIDFSDSFSPPKNTDEDSEEDDFKDVKEDKV